MYTPVLLYADLTISNAHFERGFNRVYDRNLARNLAKIFSKHRLLWNNAQVGW